jgi:hypothetical protein
VALPGPTDEVRIGVDALAHGLAAGDTPEALAERIAERLRHRLREKRAGEPREPH